MDTARVLFDLCEASGPSGAEGGAARAAGKYAEALGAVLSYDRLGNLTALFEGQSGSTKTIMLDAHLDEVSLTVTGDAGGGFFRFKTIGHDPRVLPGASVEIIAPEGNLPGVITSVPPHIQKPSEADKAYDISDLYIDTGLLDCGDRVPVGARALISGRCLKLRGDHISAPALDDRAGFVCLLRAVEILKENGPLGCNIALVGSVMEEFNSMGAAAAGFRIVPDLAVVVDVTHAKTPDASSEDTFPLGSGPAIGLGPNLDRGFAKTLQALAKRRAIPHSLEVMEGSTGTNARNIQIAGRGVPCALISIPLRYMHTPQEVMSMGDLENSAKLIAAFIEKMAGGDAV